MPLSDVVLVKMLTADALRCGAGEDALPSTGAAAVLKNFLLRETVSPLLCSLTEL